MITVWVLQVRTQSANIQGLVAVSSSPFSVTIKLQVFKPCIFSCSPCGVRQEWGLPRCYPQHLGQLDIHPGFFFPTEGTQGRPPGVILCQLGRGEVQCCQHVPFLSPSNAVWVSGVVLGVASVSAPCSRILSVVSSP